MFTFWFEFASTYSSLSAFRIGDLAEKAGVEVVWKPFLLGPIFKAQGLETSPFLLYPEKGKYMWRDMERQFELLELEPLKLPDVFPQNSLLAARIATLGLAQTWGRDFTCAVYEAQFIHGKDISDHATLSAILSTLDQDGQAVIAAALSDADNKARLRSATETAQSMGLFGAPSFTTSDGELFWGNDRLEEALNWQARL